MKRLIFTVLLLAFTFPAFAQRFVDEVATIAALKARNVGNLNKSVFVRGYYNENDGGGGTFIITNSIILADNGLKIQSSHNAAFSYLRQFSGQVNVKWFGARGGTNDDYTPLQEAINQATAKGYETFIPTETFRSSSSLTVPDNAVISGGGSSSVIFALGNTTTMTLSSRTNVVLNNFSFGGTAERQLYINGCKNIRMENVDVAGATLNLGGTTAGIHFEGCNGLTFVNPVFSGNGLGINSASFDYNLMGGTFGLRSTNVTVINPAIRNNNAKYGIVFYHATDHWVRGGNIDMNFIGSTNNISGYGLLSYGVSATPNINVNFIAVNVRNTYGSGIYYNLTDGGSIDSPKLYAVSQSQVATGLAVGAIAINFSKNIHLQSVGITNSGVNSGVVFSSTTNCSLIGGTIAGIGQNFWGIEFLGRNWAPQIKGVHLMTPTITGRRGIGSFTTAAILANAQIEGNLIDNFYDGIIIETGSSNNIVTGNRLFGAINTSIQDLGLDTLIEGNILASGGIGLYLAGTNGSIGQNTVRNHTTEIQTIGQGYNFRINVPFSLNASLAQQTLPSTTIYPDDHIVSVNTTPSTLLARWIALGNSNAFAMRTSSDLTNYVYEFNGVGYTMPRTQGTVGSVWSNDGSGNLSWMSPGVIFNFGPQFDVNLNTNINLAVGLATTNQALYGNVTAPAVNLGSVSGAIGIDCAASMEFTLLLAGNATITLTNFNDFHPVSVVLTNTGSFAITWATVDNMYWIPNGNSTQITNDWGAGIINRFTFWKTGGRIHASDKEGLAQLGGGGGAAGGNPTASVGLAAINGVSSLFMRSDAAPPLSQSITPTWSNLHIFGGDLAVKTATNLLTAFDGDLIYTNNGNARFRVKNSNGSAFTEITPDGTVATFSGGSTLAHFGLLSGPHVTVNSAGISPTQTNMSLGVLNLTNGRWQDLNLDGHINWNGTTNTVFDLAGSGSPEGAVTAAPGSLYRRYGGGAGTTIYAKESGAGNTGWVALAGGAGIATPVSIANGGTGTNTMGTAIGNVPFVSSSTNRLTVDNGNFIYDASSRVLEVFHPATTALPHFLALNVDTGVVGEMYANRIRVGGNDDFTIEVANSTRSIIFTNTGVRTLELSGEWSTVIGDGTTTTTRTNKMLYIPTFAGLPTGVPHVETGTVPIGYDTTGSKLYAYNSGWKNVAGPGHVRLPISQTTLPTSNPARLDFVSTTGLKRLLFATNETCYFQFTLPQDYGSSPVLRIPYSCSGATAGTATFSVSVWAQSPSDALAADTESYDTANVGTDTVPGTLNFPDVVVVTLTTNDSMAAGDTVAIRITSTSNALLNDLRVRGDMVLEYAKQ